MHIADGVLPAPVMAAGAAAAVGLGAWTLRSVLDEDVPKVALVTAALFVASLLSFPLGGTSVHLALGGLAGVLLGRAAFPAVAVAVTLQAALLQHGGLVTLGVNATTMGAGALVAAAVFRLRGAGVSPARDGRMAALAAGLGTLASILLYGGALLAAGEAFGYLAVGAVLVHLVLVPLEAGVAVAAVTFVAQVEPRLLRAGAGRAQCAPQGAPQATRPLGVGPERE